MAKSVTIFRAHPPASKYMPYHSLQISHSDMDTGRSLARRMVVFIQFVQDCALYRVCMYACVCVCVHVHARVHTCTCKKRWMYVMLCL